MKKFSIANWNVNSIRTRLPIVEKFIAETRPDIICLQEIKCIEQEFPINLVDDYGYNLAIRGQKTYNGVAIFSKFPIEEIKTELPGNPDPEQARFIEATLIIHGQVVRVISLYVPQGRAVDHTNFAYKLDFLRQVIEYLRREIRSEEEFIIAGDFNIAPAEIDVFSVENVKGEVGFHPKEQELLREIHNLGLFDSFRLLHPLAQKFSWWDYRAGAWQQNKGMRIDHVLVTARLADWLSKVEMDDSWRNLEKASDHIPVVAEFVIK